jgi:hypothetical protein
MRVFLAAIAVFIVMLATGIGPWRYDFMPAQANTFARGDSWTGRLDTCTLHFQNVRAECTDWWEG